MAYRQEEDRKVHPESLHHPHLSGQLKLTCCAIPSTSEVVDCSGNSEAGPHAVLTDTPVDLAQSPKDSAAHASFELTDIYEDEMAAVLVGFLANRSAG